MQFGPIPPPGRPTRRGQSDWSLDIGRRLWWCSFGLQVVAACHRVRPHAVRRNNARGSRRLASSCRHRLQLSPCRDSAPPSPTGVIMSPLRCSLGARGTTSGASVDKKKSDGAMEVDADHGTRPDADHSPGDPSPGAAAGGDLNPDDNKADLGDSSPVRCMHRGWRPRCRRSFQVASKAMRFKLSFSYTCPLQSRKALQVVFHIACPPSRSCRTGQYTLWACLGLSGSAPQSY